MRSRWATSSRRFAFGAGVSVRNTCESRAAYKHGHGESAVRAAYTDAQLLLQGLKGRRVRRERGANNTLIRCRGVTDGGGVPIRLSFVEVGPSQSSVRRVSSEL